MDKEQAKRIIKTTFESAFNKDQFVVFIKNLLNKIDEQTFVYKGNSIPDSYKDYISKYERIGKYHDDKNRIDILVVYLNRERSIERARTMQRNFVAGYLQGKYGSTSNKDAAIVAFVSPNSDDWRFSLVKMDYRFIEGEGGKVKVKEAFTPARRWSFLVGKNEASHTAQSRLVDILADDENNPTLEQLQQAFNIETITDEFFAKYRDLFIRTKQELDRVVAQSPAIQSNFRANGVDTVNFAKKLLGQIVFLYFLQKKGWFGVERDKPWGSGSKHFLRELFDGKHGTYKNFFNDILEPLFYEALRIDRSYDDHYYSRFNCKIPFLNGGLFDPVSNYDWEKTDILLPNDLFSNDRKTKEGDKGDGIFDVFDRYNFTVCEDEPLEKEVAIDPELLGKAYEKFNAIRSDNFDEYLDALKKGEESKFNKKFGVYYTPREIVHYMCQESLTHYLHNELPSIPLTDIATLVHYGELVSENEARVVKEGKETKTYEYKLPESIRKNAKTLDDRLSTLTVCDPAVGSGAFPVGLMHEVVKLRNVLSTYLQNENRTQYDLKRQFIEESLYGVDIDAGAVEITRLRLWLSLVVDEDDIHNIKPLPNLDYKVVRGNSLLSVKEDLFNNEYFAKMERLKPLHFDETNPKNKQNYKQQIDNLILQITNGHKDFDFKVYFSEVFHQKKGFDIVIGNPPYIQLQKAFDAKNKYADFYKDQSYKTFDRTGDIYCLFYEKGIQLLKQGGILTYITSNKWMRAGYGEKLRTFFTKHNPIQLIDLGPGVFENATVDTNIILIQKANNRNQLQAVTLQKEHRENISKALQTKGVILTKLGKDAWFIGSDAEQKLKEKIERIGKPLKYWDVKIYYGIKTGLNEAFIIDTAKRNEILANCKTEEERKRTESIIKPILRGRDIKRYTYEWAGLWVILAKFGFYKVANQYPAVVEHLKKYEKELRNRGQCKYTRTGKNASKDYSGQHHWLELDNNPQDNYLAEFEKEKLAWGGVITTKEFFKLRMCLIESGKYLNAPANFMVVSKWKYFLGYLNSYLNNWFYNNFIGTVLHKDGIRFYVDDMMKIPVPPITSANRPLVNQIETLADKILAAKKQNPTANTTQWEKEIDQIVYKLYDLTEDEIKIIEGQ